MLIKAMIITPLILSPDSLCHPLEICIHLLLGKMPNELNMNVNVLTRCKKCAIFHGDGDTACFRDGIQLQLKV